MILLLKKASKCLENNLKTDVINYDCFYLLQYKVDVYLNEKVN